MTVNQRAAAMARSLSANDCVLYLRHMYQEMKAAEVVLTRHRAAIARSRNSGSLEKHTERFEYDLMKARTRLHFALGLTLTNDETRMATHGQWFDAETIALRQLGYMG
jgi:hypothetical protein